MAILPLTNYKQEKKTGKSTELSGKKKFKTPSERVATSFQRTEDTVMIRTEIEFMPELLTFESFQRMSLSLKNKRKESNIQS